MKRFSTGHLNWGGCALLAVWLVATSCNAAAQLLSAAFTYQGELRLSSGPASGRFDMQFRLFDASSNGFQLGDTLNLDSVLVAEGLFSVPLDFGTEQFGGERQWLEIAIRPAGTGSYETLSPRTEVTATPYAWGAQVALDNSVTSSSIVDGSIGAADVNSLQIQRRISAACPLGQSIRQINADGTVNCDSSAGSNGTVSLIETGAGLTGGPITTMGTIGLADGGVGAAQIDAAQVQRRVSGTCAQGTSLREVNQDGSVVCTPDATGNDWSLTGNAGTDASTQFIGTTDQQALELRTANARSLRIEPSMEVFGIPALPITRNTLGGSHANEIASGVRGATIAGGGVPEGDSDPTFVAEAPNRVTDHFGSIGGGYANRAGDATGTALDNAFATVGGGIRNSANRQASTISGGQYNTASGLASSVGGGAGNSALGEVSTVGGGIGNIASGHRSVVGGGQSNTASGEYATVGGGISNCAGGALSWAGGFRAKVRPGSSSGAPGDGCSGLPAVGSVGDRGSFVWADASGADFVSTGPNQFLVRAVGGMAINSSDPAGSALRVAGTLHLDSLGSAGSITLCMNATKKVASCSSSARYKYDIVDLDAGLEAVLRLRPVGYRWKDTGTADVGFVAEEIAAIDERLVTRNAETEIEGVRYDRLTALLANAVQQLAARDSRIDATISRLEQENERLSTEVQQLRADLEQLGIRPRQPAP